jgi:plasmid stabilization system protein ParE
MFQHRFEPKAQIEYEESFNWYSERSEQAAINFVESVEESIALICSQP